jgi:hypothetical protein
MLAGGRRHVAGLLLQFFLLEALRILRAGFGSNLIGGGGVWSCGGRCARASAREARGACWLGINLIGGVCGRAGRVDAGPWRVVRGVRAGDWVVWLCGSDPVDGAIHLS